MHLMIRPIMPYDIPKLTENPFVLISGFVLVITAVLIAVVLSRYAAEAYKGNRKKATLFFAGITAFVTLIYMSQVYEMVFLCKKRMDG